MSKHSTKDKNDPPPEYEAALADLEARAARGEVTLTQARHEIFALRDRFSAGPELQSRWAAQAGLKG